MCKVLEDMRYESWQEGRKRGLREGEKRGLREGEKRGLRKGRDWMSLMAKLIEDNRFDDAQKAIADETYRDQLMGEYRS